MLVGELLVHLHLFPAELLDDLPHLVDLFIVRIKKLNSALFLLRLLRT